MRFVSSAVAAAILFAASLAHAQVTARLVPNRTSGVAPLAVFLDGSTSQASGADSIHDLHYEWNFGDPASGTWPHSGTSRNEATGPWSGHVFEQPGSYTVTLTVTAPNGSEQTTTRTIQVSDPNQVYSGTKTICFSRSGNFSGCPAGAQRTTTSSFSSALGQVATNRRLLFRRGESFTSQSRADVNVQGPGTIGAFGTGAAPRITVGHGDVPIRLSNRTPNSNDWRFMDLDFVSTAGDPSSIVGGNNRVTNVLFLRLSGSGFHGDIGIGPFGPHFYNEPINSDISVVDCQFDAHRGGLGATGLYIAAKRMLILGNSIEDTEQIEHVTRFEFAAKTVLSHNYFARPAATKVLIKLHALKRDGSWPNYSEHDSSEILISNNVFESRLDGWSVVLGPQNHFSNEHVKDAIIERNLFLAGPTTQSLIFMNGHDHTIRNNIFNMNGASSPIAVNVKPRGVEPAPSRVRVYNNTCHASNVTNAATCVSESAEVSNGFVANNLLYAPRASRKYVLQSSSSSTQERNNVLTTSLPYTVSEPTTAAQFRLAPAAAGVDAGANLSWAASDYAGLLRPASGPWDAGAYQSGGGGGGGGPQPPAAPVLLP